MRLRVLFVLVLLFVATTALGKRRASGAANHCVTGIIADQAAAGLIAADTTHIYWVDELESSIRRVSKSGGPSELLAPLDEWTVLTMVVDDTTVYIGALPFTAFQAPTPGSILSVPKTGGSLGVLISGVLTPYDVEVDATHLYWAAAGTFDFRTETVAPDGKIERALKNGTGRQALAENLSGPLDVALEDAAVWYGETGLAEGDPTVGVYLVPKSGGTVTAIDTQVLAAAIEPVGSALVVWGGTESVPNGLFVVRKDRGGVRTLVDDFFLGSPAHVFDGIAYYLREGVDANELYSVPVIGGTPTLLRDDAYFISSFDVDECAITIATVNDTIERVKR